MQNVNVNRPEMRPDNNMGMGGMGGVQQPQAPAPQASKLPWIILAVVVVVVLVVLGVLFRGSLFKTNTTAQPKLSGYQAVFLTNGQVYFGKLADANAQYVTLSDIFYLQVNQQLQQNGQPAQQNNTNPQLSLVKLGEELHGPADVMKINRDQVLFYEDLKEDGRVVQAIEKYKANPNAADQGQGNQQPTQATPTPTPTGTK